MAMRRRWPQPHHEELAAARMLSRWRPSSATFRSASFSPRTSTYWASTILRKALLTTVKEAVDNSLDACEEAGILPEIWVELRQVKADRFRVSIQDNGPGIVKKQIPLIFGKLLYGSKFHRLRMSRGQQGIGISAAGMNGWMTTGMPVKIISKTSAKKPAHYFELQINTKKNQPEIKNGRGDGVDIPPGEAGHEYMQREGIDWVSHYDAEKGEGARKSRAARGSRSNWRPSISEGKGSVDEYLEQTAIANPHVTLHYQDPEGNRRAYAARRRSCLPNRRRSSRILTAWSWGRSSRCSSRRR
jgi:DNA topoisomerase VI subunit B